MREDFDDTVCFACHAKLTVDAIEDSYCSLECAEGKVVKDIYELARLVGVSTDEGTVRVSERIAHRLYKDTECGISFYVPKESAGRRIVLSGYAEGTDCECQPYELNFPFKHSTFWETVEAADRDGCELFEATHCAGCGAEDLDPESGGICEECANAKA